MDVQSRLCRVGSVAGGARLILAISMVGGLREHGVTEKSIHSSLGQDTPVWVALDLVERGKSVAIVKC